LAFLGLKVFLVLKVLKEHKDSRVFKVHWVFRVPKDHKDSKVDKVLKVS
jgi:hypothetical protein